VTRYVRMGGIARPDDGAVLRTPCGNQRLDDVEPNPRLIGQEDQGRRGASLFFELLQSKPKGTGKPGMGGIVQDGGYPSVTGHPDAPFVDGLQYHERCLDPAAINGGLKQRKRMSQEGLSAVEGVELAGSETRASSRCQQQTAHRIAVVLGGLAPVSAPE
jgi:hypothetical protein